LSDRLRIVDFSTHLSGPLATHLLGELGADVIKVENPRTGDGNRGEFIVVDDLGLMHLALNSGSRSFAADRHSPEWPEIIAACARWADAVVVGTRPLDARRRGMDFDTMQAANPRIIYAAVSGFGEDGPWRDLTAHGQTIDSYAGLVDILDDGTQPRTRPGWRSTGTTLGGVFTALAITSALLRRERGFDKAQYVSVSLWHSAMWWSWRDLTMLANSGKRWVDYSDLGSRYSLYRASDGGVLLVAPAERHFWEKFVDIVGLPQDWKGVGNWAVSGMDNGGGPDYQHERIAIAGRLATKPRDEWVGLFAAAEIPCAPILDLESALASEHAATNAAMRDVAWGERTLRVPNCPVRFGAGPTQLDMPSALTGPPDIGAHNAEVRELWGLPPAP